jgi:hypothetical protein
MIVKLMQHNVVKIFVSGDVKYLVHWYILLLTSMTMPVYAQSEQALIEPVKIAPTRQYQVKFKARVDHDFLLAADYLFFPNKALDKNMPGVIVLHDCHSDRKEYIKLSTSIAEQGLHTLSLDLRGYGGSVTEGYSELAVKKNAIDIISYQTEVAVLKSYWPEDLLAAYNFLRKKVDSSKGISIVSSGCAGSFAVALSEQVHLNSMVLITPEMTYADKERYKNLIDIPSYFISSAQHAMSYATARELFTWNGSAHSKLQVYKGDKLNYQIIRTNKYLVNDIALWLKYTLR